MLLSCKLLCFMKNFMFIMSYLKLYFVILSLDEKYRFMDLRWLRQLLLLRKKIREEVQQLKENLLFRNIHYKLKCDTFLENGAK